MTKEQAEELVEELIAAVTNGRSPDWVNEAKHVLIGALAHEGLYMKSVRSDERLACWKIAENERATAPVDKQAWLVAFDIANAIKMRDHS